LESMMQPLKALDLLESSGITVAEISSQVVRITTGSTNFRRHAGELEQLIAAVHFLVG
jgi:hypothetical protein